MRIGLESIRAIPRLQCWVSGGLLGLLLTAAPVAAPAQMAAAVPPAATNVTGTPDPETLPVQQILALRQTVTLASNQWVRVHGLVLDERLGEYIVVHDATGTLFAETHQAQLPPVKERVELWGRLVSDGYSLRLENALVRALKSDATTAPLPAPTEQLPVLTKAWQVRDLPPEKMAWKYPVRLQGVVTVNARINRYFVMQDDTAGISVVAPQVVSRLAPGDRVVVTGVSDPGGYSPIVLASNVTVLGAGDLPPARPETIFQLASGQDGSQWIEIHGVVHSLAYTNGIARLHLSDMTGMIAVSVPAPAAPTNLLDAIVRVRGACGSEANDKRQFTGFHMWVSSLDFIQVEEPGIADPFSLPAQPIVSLTQFHPRQTLQHRVNVAGVVTLCEPGQAFFIQDGNDGVRVMAAPDGQVQPGDYVMVAGYPGQGNYGAVVRDPVFKVLIHFNLPAPQTLQPGQTLVPQLHDRWVQLEARLAGVGPGNVLTLQSADRVFEARFLKPLPSALANLPRGSLLQLQGVYRVLADESRQPSSFQITVPSAAEVTVLTEPSWWTLRHAMALVGLMAVIILATVLWVLMLRRKVGEQTASLLQSEQKFRSLVEDSLVGVYFIQDGRFVYVNPRMAAIFGYTVVEMHGAVALQNIIYPEDWPLVQEQIRRRVANEVRTAHYAFRGQCKDGTVIQVEVLGSRTQYQGAPAVLGMLLDVTERKRAQDKMSEQARLLDLAHDAISVRDLEDRVLYWNQSAEMLYGYAAEEVLGQPVADLTAVNPADFQKAKQTLLETGKWHGELSHRNREGELLTVAARWTLVRDAQGRPHSVLAINTDITQQKKLETQILRAQRMESIGTLAGGIAHNLNNVLAPIMMSCDLLKLDLEGSEHLPLIDGIRSSSQRAADLVRQILTFARGTDGRRQLVQPQHLLEELRRILEGILSKSIHLNIPASANLWALLADANQIHQVLMNLCVNARDAMPTGGELTVSAANVVLDDRQAELNEKADPGPYVVFMVTDTGTGMPPEVREKIFDPFFTTKDVGKGTGLGLSTAQAIIKSHKGFINAYSESGKGSRFMVYLPAQTSGAAAMPVALPETDLNRLRGDGELVLVVDDEEAIRSLARRTLETYGYRVVTANDGTEAITEYNRRGREVAVVLLDMMMPVLDGPATIHALAWINPEIRIIAASGLTDESFSHKISSPTVRAFLPKPYAADKMLKALRQVLRPGPGF